VISHYWYTRDAAWLKKAAPKLKRGCDFLIGWAEKNKTEELRGKGYGMIAGKIADPDDQYHGYMLNAPMGLMMRMAGTALKEQGDPDAGRYLAFAGEIQRNIAEALRESYALAPVAPLSNGAWAPAISPWPDTIGNMCLYAQDMLSFTHASVNLRDTITGAPYLILYGALAPDSQESDFLLRVNADLHHQNNTGFSQPYYGVHPYAHLRRGEVKAFLQEFYSGVTALADRETYTFWEHFHQVSPHKTHEEGWFLMRCRWMLALEEEKDLLLLGGVPRAWLENGKRIAYKGMKTMLGTVSLAAEARLSEGKVCVELDWADSAVSPAQKIRVRVPHPLGLKATRATAGAYNAGRECVELEAKPGKTAFEVHF
jgi:hypothetical protein